MSGVDFGNGARLLLAVVLAFVLLGCAHVLNPDLTTTVLQGLGEGIALTLQGLSIAVGLS